ncbi:hypothetical protein ACSBR2_022686 [Camellia fascicularis]
MTAKLRTNSYITFSLARTRTGALTLTLLLPTTTTTATGIVSTATLPPKELLLLTSLSRLPIFPSLSGTLTLCIGNLPKLHTPSLPHNLLSGLIPSQIDNIRSLQILELQGNNFFGHIPYQITYLSYLRFLNLSYNTFSGLIPDTLISFAKVNNLDCSNNQLFGPIDLHKFDAISKCESLNHLKLSNNYFFGAIPSVIGKCSNLRTLLLDGNIFQGPIPLNSSAASGGCGVGEFNAFGYGIPYEVLFLPNLQIFWAPKANLKKYGSSMQKFHWDLSSNGLQGYLLWQLQVPCMVYFNVSRNSLSSLLLRFRNNTSCDISMISYGKDPNLLYEEEMNTFFESNSDDHLSMVVHDFSWNGFSGSLSFFSFTNKFLLTIGKTLYRLLVNNNMFNGSLPGVLFSNCNDLQSFSANLSANQISVAQNRIGGLIPPKISSLKMLQFLKLSRNLLCGSLPIQLGEFKDLDLANAISLQVVLLDHNRLSGEIPASFSKLLNLIQLDLSFNNLSGHIPHLQHANDSDCFGRN